MLEYPRYPQVNPDDKCRDDKCRDADSWRRHNEK